MRAIADNATVAALRRACREAAGELLKAHRKLAAFPGYLAPEILRSPDPVLSLRGHLKQLKRERYDRSRMFFDQRMILADALEEAGAIAEAAAARADWRLDMAHQKRDFMWWSVTPLFPDAAMRMIGWRGRPSVEMRNLPVEHLRRRSCTAINRGSLVIFRPKTLRLLRWVPGVGIGTHRVRFTYQKRRGRSFKFDDQVAPGGFYALFHEFGVPPPPTLFPEAGASAAGAADPAG